MKFNGVSILYNGNKTRKLLRFYKGSRGIIIMIIIYAIYAYNNKNKKTLNIIIIIIISYNTSIL